MYIDALFNNKVEMKRLKYILVMILSFVLAITASNIFSEGRFGLDFILMCVFSLIAMLVLRNFYNQALTKIESAYMVTGMIFSLCLVFRYSEVLYYLNLFGVGIVLCLAFAQRYTGSVLSITVTDWVKTPVRLVRLLWMVIAKLVFFRLGMANLNRFDNENIRSILSGVFLAIPILFFFGYLLVSADSRFESFSADIFSFDFFGAFKGLISALLYFPLFAAFLYATVMSSEITVKSKNKSSHQVEGLKMITIMICLNALFFSYILTQFGYFFGGDQVVIESSSLTYSAYARRGFWQLVWVAIIVLPFLLTGHWLQRNENPALQKWFNRMAMIMVCAVIIIEFSAVHRMYIYIKIYGLTELRFYSSVFLFYIVGGLVSFYYTVLKGRRNSYVIAIAVQAIVIIFLLNVVNPDAIIARHNITRDISRSVDNPYLSSLSADAIPVIYEKYNMKNKSVSCNVFGVLNQKNLESSELNQWNWSLKIARQTMSDWYDICYK